MLTNDGVVMLPFTRADADLKPDNSKYKIKKQFEKGNHHLRQNFNFTEGRYLSENSKHSVSQPVLKHVEGAYDPYRDAYGNKLHVPGDFVRTAGKRYSNNTSINITNSPDDLDQNKFLSKNWIKQTNPNG